MPKSSSISDYNQLADTLKSLAHPERIAIVNLISGSREKRMTVKNIYEKLGIEQSTASRHLGILKRSGILERELEGVNTFYCLSKNKIAEHIHKFICNS